jgi:hypothetical protein
MGIEFTGGTFPGHAAEAVESARGKRVEIALDGTKGPIGERGNVAMGEAVTLEPKDFHLGLDARMGMMITVLADRGQNVRTESKGAHGCLPTTTGRNLLM